MRIDTFTKLYVHELKDLYSAENQILDALARLIDVANDDELTNALSTHRRETETHVERLRQIFSTLDFEPGGHRCKGIEGLLAETRELLDDIDAPDIVDAAIVSGCQRVEHYEMAAYGVARAFAAKLGRSADVEILTKTLEEEGAADRTLTQLAEHHVNFVATTA